MRKQAHLYYSGMVQGVGFRWTVGRLALGLDIDGFVRNLPDGRVEIVSEGEEEELKAFLGKIRSGSLGHYIRDVEESWQEPTGEFSGFSIEF